MLALSGCATGTEQLFSGGGSGTTVTVAIVSNSQMEDAISLSHLFEQDHPGVHPNFVSLPENEARAKITADVSTQGGEFDVVMISNYETPMWSANGWLVNLQPYIDATPATTPRTSCRSCGRRSRIRETCTRCRSTASPRS